MFSPAIVELTIERGKKTLQTGSLTNDDCLSFLHDVWPFSHKKTSDSFGDKLECSALLP